MLTPPTIALTTLNASYIHASLGLRYLLANMGDLKSRTALREFTIARPAGEVVEQLLLTLSGAARAAGSTSSQPQIIGFGVYIWNVRETTAVVRLLKTLRPDITVVLGGPEVSHETHEQEIVALADHVITGWGDVSFATLCGALLQGVGTPAKLIPGEQAELGRIVLPYAEYSAADLAHRIVYVEASRGCPFKCEFCLSALDKTAWAFDLAGFLGEMERLYRRGARHFKFVDRTFNLKIDSAVRILQFFLDRLAETAVGESGGSLFLHFEVVPDHLPEPLRAMIVQFPPGVLQFEVGVQSFSADVQQRISRRQDNTRTEANLRWLLARTAAHVHADLLFGLPGETLESFAAGFDRLYAMAPHEIQLGMLKRLRGTPIARHALAYGMIYDPAPPYSLQQTSRVDADTMQRMARFARYWDVLANSGRFPQTLALLLQSSGPQAAAPVARHAPGYAPGHEPNMRPSPFQGFMSLSDWLWQRTGKTHGLSPELLVDALFDYLCAGDVPAERVRQALLADYLGSGARGHPQALRGRLPKRDAPVRRRQLLTQRQEHHRSRCESN